MTASISVTPLPEAATRTALTPSTSPTRGLDGLAVTAGHDEAGSAAPAGKDWASRSPAAIASGFWRNWSAPSSPVWIWVMPPAMTARAITVTVTKPAGRFATALPTRRQSELASARPTWPDVRHLGPEDPPTEDDEGGGQDDEGEEGGDDDTDGAGQAEAAGRGEEREQEGEQAEHDGGRAGEHGLGGAAQGDGHGVTAVLR